MKKQFNSMNMLLVAALLVAIFLTMSIVSSRAKNPGPVPELEVKDALAELGKRLFYDSRLSADASLSFSSCHQSELSFTDGQTLTDVSTGSFSFRNVPTLINVAHRDAWFHKMVFGSEWSKISNAWRAIATFERTIVQNGTLFDNYFNEVDDALDASQISGLKLFYGKVGCFKSPNSPLFTKQKYYNTGIPPLDERNDDALKQITFRYELYVKGFAAEMYRTTKDDPGFYFRPKEEADKGMFRTPSLRYTLNTQPYMHNSMLATLEDIVEFHNQGRDTNEFAKNKTSLIEPLNLSDSEQTDFENFLKSLSGDEILVEESELLKYALLPVIA